MDNAGGLAAALDQGKDFPGGFIASSVAGRTDRHPINVPNGAHVIPADVVSGMGQGNSIAGAEALQDLARMAMESGAPAPEMAMKRGGSVSKAPILAAGGEFVMPPEAVIGFGGGNPNKGHRWLDNLIKTVRMDTAKRMMKLPPPKK